MASSMGPLERSTDRCKVIHDLPTFSPWHAQNACIGRALLLSMPSPPSETENSSPVALSALAAARPPQSD